VQLFALGVSPTDMAVYNMTTQIMMFLMMVVSSFATAVTIRMNVYLGRGETDTAKFITQYGVALMIVFLVMFSILFRIKTHWFVLIFSNDPVLFQEFDDYSSLIAVYLVFYGAANELSRVLNNMGRTK